MNNNNILLGIFIKRMSMFGSIRRNQKNEEKILCRWHGTSNHKMQCSDKIP